MHNLAWYKVLTYLGSQLLLHHTEAFVVFPLRSPVVFKVSHPHSHPGRCLQKKLPAFQVMLLLHMEMVIALSLAKDCACIHLILHNSLGKQPRQLL